MDGVCHLSWAVDLPGLVELVVQVLLHSLQPGEAFVTLFQGREQWMNLFVWEVAALCNPASGMPYGKEEYLLVVMVALLKEGA